MPKKVLVVGDMHAPWTSIEAINSIYLSIAATQPDVIVQIGDLYDLYSFSKFARSHDVCTPGQELTEGRALAENFWKNVNKFAPKASCYQLKGNHDERIPKRVEEKFPEIASLLKLDEFWKFPGVTTLKDEREELLIDDVMYIHGYRSKLGDHARYNLKSTVVGHSHTGGVFYMRLGNKTIWELNCGFIAKSDEVPLSYTRQRTTRWTIGYGLIDEQGPRFIPL